VPDPATTALTAAQHCAAVAALNLDLACSKALLDSYQERGDAAGVEGCRQTIRKCVEAVDEHLAFFRDVADPKEAK
jgi:hypothetical protein